MEGGFDRPYEPATCFAPTIALGRHAGPGEAESLWRDYERVLDVVPSLGLDGVRLTIEWARVEPRRGVVDPDALARYAQVIRYARSLGLDVTVALCDAAWPSWLGLEAWLLPWVVPHVVTHATRVVTELGDDVTGVVAFTDPIGLVTRGFLLESAPPWRRDATADAASAHRQIDQIVERLRSDPEVGPRMVGVTHTIALDLAPEVIAQQRASVANCDEVYLRSLVKGAGPTSAPAGLLAKHGDVWSVVASPDLLRVLS